MEFTIPQFNFCIIVFIALIHSKIDPTDQYTLVTASKPHKKLYLFRDTARLIDMNKTKFISDIGNARYKLNIEIQASTDPESTKARIHFAGNDKKYLCWKKQKKTDGVVGCNGNGEKAEWFLYNEGGDNVYKITNGDFCLTQGIIDPKDENKYFIKTEECNKDRNNEQRFIINLLIEPETPADNGPIDDTKGKEPAQEVNDMDAIPRVLNESNEKDEKIHVEPDKSQPEGTNNSKNYNGKFTALVEKMDSIAHGSHSPGKKYERCPLNHG